MLLSSTTEMLLNSYTCYSTLHESHGHSGDSTAEAGAMMVAVGWSVGCVSTPELDSELVGTELSKGAETNRRAVGPVCVLISPWKVLMRLSSSRHEVHKKDVCWGWRVWVDMSTQPILLLVLAMISVSPTARQSLMCGMMKQYLVLWM